jgi:hypothetical protein
MHALPTIISTKSTWTCLLNLFAFLFADSFVYGELFFERTAEGLDFVPSILQTIQYW